MNRLIDKVAFITGAGRGQGRAIALKFAAEGADIVVSDIARAVPSLEYDLASQSDLEETASCVRRLGRGCLHELADVRDQGALDRVVERGLAKFGKIDICVANAGAISYREAWAITEEEWSDQIAINLTGAWHTAKAVIPHMMSRFGGCIIFTSSVNGVEAGWGFAHYVAAKHGVIGLMKCLALELGQFGIRANAVLPGPVHTAIDDNPVAREKLVGHEGATTEEYLNAMRSWHVLRGRTALPPDAIADGMIWLASEEAAHVTGIQLVIDAGHLILPGVNPHPIVD